MLSTFALILLSSGPSVAIPSQGIIVGPASQIDNKQATVDLIPTDDVWVYPYASDPSKDVYLRAWGTGGKSVAGPQENIDEFSYSYLSWSLKDLPRGSKIVEAKLILTHVANPDMTTDMVRRTPLEARPMPSGFSEKGWQQSMAAKFSPEAGDKAPFGKGGPDKAVSEKDTKFEIDLLAGPGDFKAYFDKARATGDGALALALTSAIDPSDLGRSAVYKVYSKDGPQATRPILRLKFSN